MNDTKDRKLLYASAVCFGVAILIYHLMGCGSALQKRINSAEKYLSKSEDTFVAWDRGHQLEIVEAYPASQAIEKIAAYRAKRNLVLLAFTTAWDAIHAFAVDPTPANWDVLVRRGELLKRSLEKLMKEKP